MVETCPECLTGKHRNCDGTVWNNRYDRLELCECYCRASQSGRSTD